MKKLTTLAVVLIALLSCTKQEETAPTQTEPVKIDYQILSNSEPFEAVMTYPDGKISTHVEDSTLFISKKFDHVYYTAILVDPRQDGYFQMTISIDDQVVRDTAVWLDRWQDFVLEYHYY